MKEREEFFGCLRDGKTDSKEFILDKIRLLAIYHQTISNTTIQFRLKAIIDDPNVKDLEKIEQSTQSLADKMDAKMKEYLQIRRLKPQKDEVPTANDNDPKKMGIKLLRGIATKVTTQGKGILKSVLPGAE